MIDLQIYCHFTTQNSETALTTNDETNTFFICKIVLSEQLKQSLSYYVFVETNFNWIFFLKFPSKNINPNLIMKIYEVHHGKSYHRNIYNTWNNIRIVIGCVHHIVEYIYSNQSSTMDQYSHSQKNESVMEHKYFK